MLQDLYNHIEKFEGGLANHPNDPGGLTNKGVTIGTYLALAPKFGLQATREGLIGLTKPQWEKFVKYYWDKVQGDQIRDKRISAMLTELRWGGGDGRVKWILDRIFKKYGKNEKVSVPISKKNADTINSLPVTKAFHDMHELRMHYYDVIIGNNSALGVFKKGWHRRANEFYETFKKKTL